MASEKEKRYVSAPGEDNNEGEEEMWDTNEEDEITDAEDEAEDDAEDEMEETNEEYESPIDSAEMDSNEEEYEEKTDNYDFNSLDIGVGSDQAIEGDEKAEISISTTMTQANLEVDKAESKVVEVASVGTSIALPKPVKVKLPPIIREGGSTVSLHSKYSAPEVGDASQLDLFHEAIRVESDSRGVPPVALPEDEAVTESIEAKLHRSTSDKAKKKLWNNISQTKEMSLVNKYMAEKVFRHYYPIRDDYVPPSVPSRKASLETTVEKVGEDKDGDKVKIGPKIKWPRKMRLLPPLPENYYKSSTFCTGSEFTGQYVNGEFQHGNYIFPLGATYESEFENGHIHTSKHKGLITYPRGDTFEGEWKKGRHTSGNIIFGDDLEYERVDWKYCLPPDRRFYIERDIGVKPAGRTLYNDRIPQPLIPPGHYDTGDGVYNPATGVVTGFNGQKLRDANLYECQWILQNCRKFKTVEERYTPKFHPTRLPGSFAEKYVKQ